MEDKIIKIEIKLHEEEVNIINKWREQYLPDSSLPQAIKALSLNAIQESHRRFSNGDKMALTLFHSLFTHLNCPDLKKLKVMMEGLRLGYEWAINMEIDPDFHLPITSPAGYVIATLEMWDTIESSFESFSKDDKDIVLSLTKREMATQYFGFITGTRQIKFNGFNQQNQTEMTKIADFIINTAGRFERFKGRTLVSASTEDTQRDDIKKLEAFIRVRTNSDNRMLTPFEVREILLARSGISLQELQASRIQKVSATVNR